MTTKTRNISILTCLVFFLASLVGLIYVSSNNMRMVTAE